MVINDLELSPFFSIFWLVVRSVFHRLSALTRTKAWCAHKTVCERHTGIRHTFAQMIHTKYVKKRFYTPTFSHIKMYTAVKKIFYAHTIFDIVYTC